MFPKFILIKNIPTEFYQFYRHAHHLVRTPYNTVRYRQFRAVLHEYGMTRIPLFTVAYCEKGYYEMARNFNIEFVDCRLSKDDIAPMQKLAATHKNDLALILEAIAHEGYTFKGGWYPDKQSFAVFVAPDNNNSKNKQKMLSSWSDDIAEAYLMCLYKIVVVFKSGEWEVADGVNTNWG